MDRPPQRARKADWVAYANGLEARLGRLEGALAESVERCEQLARRLHAAEERARRTVELEGRVR